MSDAAVQSRCDNCGGNLSWDAAAGNLVCPSCGAIRAVPEDPAHPQGGFIVEHDLEAAFARTKPRGRIGAGSRQIKCNECAAVVEFPDGVTAARCAFCDSPSVLAQDARTDHYLPESLVPFGVTREQSVGAFKKWLGGLWFRPGDLKDKASVSELRGVYVPYWSFDTQVTSRWSADAGYHHWDEESYTVTENGRQVRKTRRVRKTRWQPASGQRHDSYDDLLICASKGLPPGLAAGVSQFETGALVTYAPQYLQGFQAESYSVDLKEAWRAAQQRIASSQEQRCSKDVPGDTNRNLRATHQYQNARFKHVLLPVWVAAFRYRDKVYQFLVNGQTGKVVGKAPISFMKVLLLIAVIVAVVVGIVLLLKLRN
jgi:hypothetical protein